MCDVTINSYEPITSKTTAINEKEMENIMEQSYVTLKDVRKTYHMGEVSIHAVDGVNFEIQKGEFVVIVGPKSGCCTSKRTVRSSKKRCRMGRRVEILLV